MELTVKNICAYDKSCVGCLNSGKDVMISVMVDQMDGVHDLFLTTDQARELMRRLKEVDI